MVRWTIPGNGPDQIYKEPIKGGVGSEVLPHLERLISWTGSK